MVCSPDGQTTLVGDEKAHHFASVAEAAASGVFAEARLVWWNARSVRAYLNQVAVQRCWDLAAVHRMIVGGTRDDPAACWALSQHLSPPAVQGAAGPPDLFAPSGVQPITAGAHLPADAGSPQWLREPAHRVAWGRAALTVARWQHDQLATRVGDLSAAFSESGAAALCVELERTGLPVDRAMLGRLITWWAGPRPADESDAAKTRRRRDELVWQHTPGQVQIDLRNPIVVRDMLRQAGIRVDDTRAWHLEPYRAGSPLVDALLTWRKAERIATTYGWHWVDTCVGNDDRLRGQWDASDGGAGRMTAGSGLHSLPTTLRPAVAAAPDHVLVRADLGQIEPRVLAVVSRDPALAQASRADDLYSGVAAELGVDRPTAKIAMLAAMYGQTSGDAGRVLDRFERTYPTAMNFLRAAALAGETGVGVTTYGGRLVPASASADDTVASTRARGRFTRNAVVQGAAAEFFKAWALTVRAAVRPLGGEIVLCLHDELLVHTPAAQADSTLSAVNQALQDAARRWSRAAPVRFVSDTSVIHRWSEAKA